MPKAIVTFDISLPALKIGISAEEAPRIRIPVPVEWADDPSWSALTPKARKARLQDEAEKLALAAILEIPRVEDLGPATSKDAPGYNQLADALVVGRRDRLMVQLKTSTPPAPKAKASKAPAPKAKAPAKKGGRK